MGWRWRGRGRYIWQTKDDVCGQGVFDFSWYKRGQFCQRAISSSAPTRAKTLRKRPATIGVCSTPPWRFTPPTMVMISPAAPMSNGMGERAKDLSKPRQPPMKRVMPMAQAAIPREPPSSMRLLDFRVEGIEGSFIARDYKAGRAGVLL